MNYGFVYIWYDLKRNMFYIGSHWGTVDDGYICSSTRMRNSYKRRSETFKRKILAIVVSNRKQLLLEEYKWLSKIKDKELGKKYYNMTKYLNGHWSTDLNRYISSKEKMSLNHKSKKGITNQGKEYKKQKETSLCKLKGDKRTQKQKEATEKLKKFLTGKKRSPYPKEHGEKVSRALKGRKTGKIPKSAFKKGNIPWNKKKEIYNEFQ